MTLPRRSAREYYLAAFLPVAQKIRPLARARFLRDQADMEEHHHMKMRTAIMVASMIILPLAAVIGVKWPHFVAVGKQTSRSTAASSGTGSRGDREVAASPHSTATATAAAETARRKLDPHIAPATAVESAGDTEPARIVPLPLPAGANTDIRAEALPTTLPVGGDATTAGGDPYTSVQNRLRALGATYYALETWGADGRAFRFQCRLAAGHNPNYHRHFEATDGDPLRAMRTVLDDVEAWKAGRLP